MSTTRLLPWPEARAAAAAAWRAGRIARDSMTPDEAADAAWRPGGPSREEIAQTIRDHRAAALAARRPAAA